MKMHGLSLRYKLMAALMIIPIVGLSLFLLIAKNIFEKDKIAYVFDSSLSVSKTRAARVSSEVSSVISLAQAIVLSYRSDTKNLADVGTYYFERESKFDAFELFAWNPDTSSYEKNVDLAKPTGKRILAESDKETLELVNQARLKPIVIQGVAKSRDRLLLAVRFGDVTDPKHVVAVALFDATELAQVFMEDGPYLSFLARRSDEKTIFSSLDPNSGWGPESVLEALSKKKTPEGIEELKSKQGVRYLSSFSEVGVGDLIVVSMVDRRAALQAVDVLLRKSVLFFIAVLAMTAFIAVFASRSMTQALSKLSFATLKVAQGDFEVRVDGTAGGEIGLLARSFNAMAIEVARLMRETAEKARMEAELATAKTVQETLFPENLAQLGSIEIAGHYEPASECGGDWWYYCETGDKVYIWIGDATGHGAPAALLTSAARAVVSVLTYGPPRPVSECLNILNRAICETSKSKMMMTFFLASIDKNTGLMTYSNASHESPYILHELAPGVEPKRDDFEPITDVNNPRLGEQVDRIFKESKVQLKPGDSIIFYTDGILDVKNGEQKSWGERRFLKSLSAQLKSDATAQEALKGIVHSLEEYREASILDDDVTLIVCRYKQSIFKNADGDLTQLDHGQKAS